MALTSAGPAFGLGGLPPPASSRKGAQRLFGISSATRPVSKTHNLLVLALQAADLDTDFLAWRAQVTGLTPYASEFRYPDSRLEPAPEEFQEALTAAQELYIFVLSKLPAASHP